MLKGFKSAIKWVIAIVAILLVAFILLNVNGLSVSRKIATIGGIEVTDAEYKFYLESAKMEVLSDAGLTEATEGFWDSEIDGKKASELAKEKAKDQMIQTNIAVSKAKEAKLKLTDEEKATAWSYTEGTSADEKAQIKEIMKTIGASKDVYAEIIEKDMLRSKYYQHLDAQEDSVLTVDADEVGKVAAEKYARVKHVLISNTPPTQTLNEENPSLEPVDAEAYAEDAKKKAEDVLKKAVAGENFDKLVDEFGEDPGMEGNEEGYIIDENGATPDGSGSMVPEFTAGSFAVKAGEVNPELVESSYGWHIIKRLPLDTESESYSTILSGAESDAKYDKFVAYLDSFVESIETEINEKLIAKIKVK